MILHEVSVNAAGRVSVLLGSVDKSLRGVPDVPSVTARLTAIILVHHMRLVLGGLDGSIGE